MADNSATRLNENGPSPGEGLGAVFYAGWRRPALSRAAYGLARAIGIQGVSCKNCHAKEGQNSC
jgi:hypothetical protein